jgi:endonuclease/exonuclease/phosphatase family metal-dependent hydrolase
MSGIVSYRPGEVDATLTRMTKTFSATTYNVLAQRHIHRERYPRSPAGALEAAPRRERLLRRLDEHRVDLLCLQEVEPDLHELLTARLGATHHAAFAPRAGRGDGVALYAARSRFAWHGHELLRFAARGRDEDLALIASLSLEDRPLRVAVTHLAWQPDSTPLDEHVGRRQMLELLARRDADADADAIWIFAGDFNAISQSVVVEAAYQRGMAESCRAQRPWDTCAINGRPRKIDYLLFSAGRLEPHPGVLPKLSRDSVLPSLDEPSDHLPLRVDFTI